MGVAKLIRLPESYWEFCYKIGNNNYAEGVREMIKAMEVAANQHIRKQAELFGCSSTIEALAQAIKDKFPGIESGRKNHTDLASEIVLGEAIINESLERIVNIVQLRIKCPNGSGKIVVEDRQVLKNGKVVERRDNGKRRLPTEKMYSSENPVNAAFRAVSEELGISASSVVAGDLYISPNTESAYVGIKSFAILHPVMVEIAVEDYRIEYQEVGENKTTYFIWE